MRDFKVIVIYLKNLLTFKYRQISLIPLSMAVGVCKQKQRRSTRMADFFTRLQLNTSLDHVERERTSHSSCWMCFCTLINQFIKLEHENHYENTKQHTIDKIYLRNISGDYHGDD